MLWLVALVAITVGSTVAGNDYRNDFSLPGTESQAADRRVRRARARAGGRPRHGRRPGRGRRGRGGRRRSTRWSTTCPGSTTSPPYSHRTRRRARSPTTAPSGSPRCVLDDQAGFVPTDDKKAIIDTAQDHEADGLRVELTGDAVREVAGERGRRWRRGHRRAGRAGDPAVHVRVVPGGVAAADHGRVRGRHDVRLRRAGLARGDHPRLHAADPGAGRARRRASTTRCWSSPATAASCSAGPTAAGRADRAGHGRAVGAVRRRDRRDRAARALRARPRLAAGRRARR